MIRPWARISRSARKFELQALAQLAFFYFFIFWEIFLDVFFWVFESLFFWVFPRLLFYSFQFSFLLLFEHFSTLNNFINLNIFQL
jgi:hypothetical protein